MNLVKKTNKNANEADQSRERRSAVRRGEAKQSEVERREANGSEADRIGLERSEAALNEAYADAAFVRVMGEGSFPDTKNVVRTNFIDIGWAFDDRCGRLLLFSAEDNLGKGASSQGVQSFNLMFGLPEAAGLENF